MADIISPTGAKLTGGNRLFALMADGTKLDLGDPQIGLFDGVVRIVSSRKMLTNGLIVAVVLKTGNRSATQRLHEPVPMVIGQTFTGKVEIPIMQSPPPAPAPAKA
jgi:hypothetical protein